MSAREAAVRAVLAGMGRERGEEEEEEEGDEEWQGGSSSGDELPPAPARRRRDRRPDAAARAASRARAEAEREAIADGSGSATEDGVGSGSDSETQPPPPKRQRVAAPPSPFANGLGADVLAHVLEYTDPVLDLVRAEQVSRLWRDTARGRVRPRAVSFELLDVRLTAALAEQTLARWDLRELREAVLDGAEWARNSTVEALARAAPRLESLSLRGCPVGDAGVAAACALPLRYLCLCGTRVRNALARPEAAALARTLTSLDVSNCPNARIGPLLEAGPPLEALDVSVVSLPARDLWLVAERLHGTLRALYARHTVVVAGRGPRGTFDRVLARCALLETLNVSGCEAARELNSESASLRVLVAGRSRLLAFAARLPALERLDLSWTPAGGSDWAVAAADNASATLELVDLSGTTADARVYEGVRRAVRPGCRVLVDSCRGLPREVRMRERRRRD